MRILFCLTLIAFTLAACCDEDHNGVQQDEFIVFGHFYGECGGEGCVEIFKLEDGMLYEDTLDQYPGSSHRYIGQWVQLSDVKYDLVKGLWSERPSSLEHEQENVIGQPDAGDWGGIYVEYDVASNCTCDGFWLLDKNENNMNAEYNAFVDKIEDRIALINQ